MIDDVQLDACNFYKYSEKILIIIYFNAIDTYFLGLTFRLSTDHGRTNGLGLNRHPLLLLQLRHDDL